MTRAWSLVMEIRFPLAPADQPLDLELADFDGDGTLDIAVVDRGGFFVIYGRVPDIRPNTSRETARDLGIVVHTAQPTLTILPGHEDSWFRLQVARESVVGAGDQVLDFSAGFAHVAGAGLRMEVVDGQGNQRGIGDRFRIVADQGEILFIHVFGVADATGTPGAGAYSLVIDTLPQLVAVEAPTLLPGERGLPGGPTSALVLVWQGNRLDPTAAEKPENYRVTWLGPDNRLGTADDRILVVGAGINSTPSVIYNPSGNRDVTSGRTYPTAVRQTVTLLFPDALPAGSYQIEVSPDVQAATFNSDELSLLTPRVGFTGHGVVSLVAGEIHEGVRRTIDNLVVAPGSLGNFDVFANGTRFLTQLHADLGVLLDGVLSDSGDKVQRNTEDLLQQIIARITPALGPVGQRLVSLWVILLDPVSISLVDPEGKSFGYDLQNNKVANSLSRSFVEVGGNVELVVLAQPAGIFQLNVSDVPPLARGGVAYLGNQQDTIQVLTAALRAGERSFQLGFENRSTPSSVLFSGVPAFGAPTVAATVASISAQGERPKSATSSVAARGSAYEQAASTQQYFASRFVGDRSASRWQRLQDRWQQFWSRLLNDAKAPQWSVLQAARDLWKLVFPFALNKGASWKLRQAVTDIVRELQTELGEAAQATLPAGQPAASGRDTREGSSDTVTGKRFMDRQETNHQSSPSGNSRSRQIYATITRHANAAGAMAPLPDGAGTDADRSAVSGEDRRFGHRATDDARSAPGAEPVSR